MLNYCTHAITDLRKLAKAMKTATHPDTEQMEAFIAELRSAEKFVLPDRGTLIHDPFDVPEGVEMTRLPYRMTAIEVPFSSDTVTDNTVSSSRRVILAQEVLVDLDNQTMRRTNALETPNAVRVDVACWVDSARRWNLQSAGAIVMIGTRSETRTKPLDDPYAANRMGPTGFPMMVCARLETTVGQQVQQVGDEVFSHSVTNDVGTEIRILAEMLTVLSCQNVSTEKQSPPEKLARARISSGNEPFYDCHVLVVGNSRLSGDGAASEDDGQGYKVRQHLRRGHIRRLASGPRIWVNQTVVAPGSPRGEAEKTYRVKKPS